MKIGPTFLAILLVMASGVPGNLAEVCEQDPYHEYVLKEYIEPLSGEPELNDHQKSILEHMCDAGHVHTNNPQFAVLYIHEDSSNNEVEWKSGNSSNVMCDAAWQVDETVNKTVSLKTGSKETGAGSYSWYSHDLPMWPILNQYFSHRRRFIARRHSQSKPDCPNYAIATPADKIKDVCENWKKFRMSVGMLSSSGYDSEKFVNQFMKMFLNKDKTECLNNISDLENYCKWLQPLVRSKLLCMMKSAKKLNGKRCPSELYVFLCDVRLPPRRFVDHLKRDLKSILAKAKCPKTTPVIGLVVTT